jgi:hypothetical protein
LARAFSGLNGLLEKFRESSHDYVVNTEIFPSLDVERVTRDMQLAEEGEARGAQNQPSKSAKSLDDFELSIVGKIQDAKNAAHHNLEDQLHLFTERLASLDFQGQFSDIQKTSAEGVSDFKAEIVKGRNELHGLRRGLDAAEKDFDHFQKTHRITRAPRVSEGSVMFFKISVLILVFLFEVIANGFFLAKGSEMGVVGGIVEAIAFSFLNIGFTLILALFCVSLTAHRSWFLKLIGLASILVYVSFAVSLNLLLAHYREISGTFFDEAGVQAIARMRNDPFGLTDIKSWLLFGTGVIFSIIAFIDGWYLRDPYLGYAGVHKRLIAAREKYVNRQEYLIDNLIDVRDEHNEKVDAIIKSLSGRRREHNAIIAHRSKMLSLFTQYQDQLERTANMLLRKYRDANIKARTTDAPKYFDNTYKLERIKPTRASDAELSDKDISASITKAQAELTDQIKNIAAVCEGGIDEFRELDKLHPEATNV